MTKRRIALTGSLLALALFVALNALAGVSLRSARVDLTAERLYTLSDGARRIARAVDEPIRLQFFFSEEAANDAPAYKNYAQRVREFLEEFTRASDGELRLEVLNPEPFSEAEDLAEGAGLVSLPLDTVGTRLYLGLLGTNSVDDREVIPLFDPGKEAFLEYDIARMVYTLANPERVVVGLMSSLPVQGGFDPTSPGRPSPSWAIVDQLRSLFEVRPIHTTITEIPAEVDVLVLIHPKGLSEDTLYAVDQFVLAGGRLVACLDPLCEADQSGAQPGNPMAAMTADRSSDLGPLLSSWGVSIDMERVVADRRFAQRVRTGSAQGPQVVDYVVWLGLDSEACSPDSPISGSLRGLNFATAGAIVQDDPDIDFEPLLRSSTEAMAMDRSRVQFMPDPAALLTEFRSEERSFTLAARIGGALRSAFPDGPPSAEASESEDEEPETEEAGGHLAASTEPAQIVLVADADFLLDQFWIQEERIGPISLGWRILADNGNLILNACELLGGSQDLIAIRSRGRFARPFEKVRELERSAEARYLAEERALQERIRESEQRINELQREKQGDSMLILSPEQQSELDRLQETMLAARKDLREVRHNLRKDIERLGNRLTYLNVGLMPVLVAVSAVLLGFRRAARRRRAAGSA